MGIGRIVSDLPWYKKMEVLRITNSWTQEEAAEKCRTNQKMYWSWEKGKNYPRKRSQCTIANAYNVRVEEIFPV